MTIPAAALRLHGCRDTELVVERAWLPALCRSTDGYPMEAPRRWIRFEEPDEAYLTAAALRRCRDGVDVILIPTTHGPALDIARDALADPFVRSVVRRFGGRLDGALDGEDRSRYEREAWRFDR